MSGKHSNFRTRTLVMAVIRRLFSPRHLREAWRRGQHPLLGETASKSFGDGKEKTAYANPQLQLYANILPAGFLHYGFFEDPGVDPTTISLAEIENAQRRYSERLLEKIIDQTAPVLDVGAGMGGISEMLLERGFSPVALTPDRAQARHIRSTYPKIPVLEGRFHEVGFEKWWSQFGTVLTAESFQYLFLDNAMSLIARLLKPGGRWVLCDYFRRSQEVKGSGHLWPEFVETAASRGWTHVEEIDITANVAPTMAFAHMLGEQVGVPALHYFSASLRRKRPQIHYLCEEAIEHIQCELSKRVKNSSTEKFIEARRYMLVVLERSRSS